LRVTLIGRQGGSSGSGVRNASTIASKITGATKNTAPKRVVTWWPAVVAAFSS
jgi:hypothetical protein